MCTCSIFTHKQESAISSLDLEVSNPKVGLNEEMEVHSSVETDKLRTVNKHEGLLKAL